MPNVDYARFHRLVSRCMEVAGEQGAPQVLVEVYGASSKQYRRIHLQSRAGAPEGDEAPPPSSQLN